jgi:hypothetical protein
MTIGTQKVIAPVAGQPEHRAAAVAVLPDQHQHAVRCGEAGEVQDDRLGGEQQAADRPCQHDEGDERDEREQQREAAVDGVVEVDALRSRAGHAEHGGIAAHRGAHASDQRGPAGRAGLGPRQHRDERGAGPRVGGAGWRHRRPHALKRAEPCGHPPGVGRFADDHDDRSSTPVGIPPERSV